jgi:glycosyltransferase involved in cell wall biosynthesis
MFQPNRSRSGWVVGSLKIGTRETLQMSQQGRRSMVPHTVLKEKSVSIVMLVYNEAEIIEGVIRECYEKVAKRLPNCEFIVAEDGSTDGTKEILSRLKEEIPIRLVSGSTRKGYVRAYRDAMALPENEIIFFTDSSGKQDPDDFWNLFPFTDSYDIVSGYKKKRKDPMYRIAITKIFNSLVSVYYGIRVRDIDSGFKLIARKAVQDILKYDWIATDLISFETTVRMLYKGYSFIEVPITHKSRQNGPSRGLPAKKIPKVVFRILRNFPEIKRQARSAAEEALP